jgi:hypothetical protein
MMEQQLLIFLLKTLRKRNSTCTFMNKVHIAISWRSGSKNKSNPTFSISMVFLCKESMYVSIFSTYKDSWNDNGLRHNTLYALNTTTKNLIFLVDFSFFCFCHLFVENRKLPDFISLEEI